jgi:hypothetical protein
LFAASKGRGGSHRADLKHLAVVAGFQRNTKLAAAVQPGHHRHHGHDCFASAVVERSGDVWLLAEPDQVAGGRERQLEPTALAAGQRLARRQPDRIGGFLPVMGASLLRRCGRRKNQVSNRFGMPSGVIQRA